MEKHTVEYYDWIEEVGPDILVKLNELLVAKGIESLEELHGGTFKDGKWVGVLESNDYRNYWHAYLHLWGEDLRNDSFQFAYFPDPDDDEEWNDCNRRLREWTVAYRGYEHSDPNWTDDLVTAVRGVVKENFPANEYGTHKVLFWWCW
jgi:hypothetical protein